MRERGGQQEETGRRREQCEVSESQGSNLWFEATNLLYMNETGPEVSVRSCADPGGFARLGYGLRYRVSISIRHPISDIPYPISDIQYPISDIRICHPDWIFYRPSIRCDYRIS